MKRVSRSCGGFFDLPVMTSQLAAYEVRMADGHFWDDPHAAQKTIGEANAIRAKLDPLKELEPKVLLPGHCSGWRVKYEIEKEMPGR